MVESAYEILGKYYRIASLSQSYPSCSFRNYRAKFRINLIMLNINDMLPIKTNGRTIPINELRYGNKDQNRFIAQIKMF